MSDPAFLIPAAPGTVAVLVRLPSLRRNARDPLLRSVAAYLLTATAVLYFGATSVIVRVNRATGVPNFATLSFCCILLGSGVPLLLRRFKEPWRDRTRYRRPATLSRVLHGLTPGTAVVGLPLHATVGVRRLHREAGIHDGLLTLNPYFDLTPRARTLADAPADGATAADAARRSATDPRRPAREGEYA
ncbi:hypothetical protein ACQKM2_15720 [Streptomyces sp. NPDC004126]|uniref:hypothetical protein n=1 Tax=Streptomyces sp. NPDC004126 TaxID=3390695 RepID=UPI003D08883B